MMMVVINPVNLFILDSNCKPHISPGIISEGFLVALSMRELISDDEMMT